MGLGAARKLAVDGASVVICGRREEAVQNAVSSLAGEGISILGFAADVSKSTDVQNLVSFTVERFGGIDILVNSAGIQRYG